MFNGGPYFLHEYAHVRQQEMIEAAENHRLLSQAMQTQENARIQQYKLYQKALLKLGEKLVRWGTNLQGRYIREKEAAAQAAYQQHEVFGK